MGSNNVLREYAMLKLTEKRKNVLETSAVP